MADAVDSKSTEGNLVRVRLSPRASHLNRTLEMQVTAVRQDASTNARRFPVENSGVGYALLTRCASRPSPPAPRSCIGRSHRAHPGSRDRLGGDHVRRGASSAGASTPGAGAESVGRGVGRVPGIELRSRPTHLFRPERDSRAFASARTGRGPGLQWCVERGRALGREPLEPDSQASPSEHPFIWCSPLHLGRAASPAQFDSSAPWYTR